MPLYQVLQCAFAVFVAILIVVLVSNTAAAAFFAANRALRAR